MERQVGFAPTALEFCRLFLWTTQALTHSLITFYVNVYTIYTSRLLLYDR